MLGTPSLQLGAIIEIKIAPYPLYYEVLDNNSRFGVDNHR